MHPGVDDITKQIIARGYDIKQENNLKILDIAKKARIFKPVQVYIDGSNLLIGSSSVVFDLHKTNEGTTINIGILNKKIQNQFGIFRYKYNFWFGLACIISGMKDGVYFYNKPLMFISANPNSKRYNWSQHISRLYGFKNILTSSEDAEMKNHILKDAKNDKVEHFIIGTGDGNQKEVGLSFLSVVHELLERNKNVTVCGFKHSTHRGYFDIEHDRYEFINLDVKVNSLPDNSPL